MRTLLDLLCGSLALLRVGLRSCLLRRLDGRLGCFADAFFATGFLALVGLSSTGGSARSVVVGTDER
jgi:hypothetical protein